MSDSELARNMGVSMEAKDYYSILEVAPGATFEQIKQSYRRLVRRHHPDLNQGKADTRIKQLNEAYAILSDTVKRAAYDAQRLEAARNAAVLETMRRLREEAASRERMTWGEGVTGFVHELKKELGTDQAPRKTKMTWAQGLSGFTRELKKGLRDD
jgi:curved DNA-binding protein CbpA